MIIEATLLFAALFVVSLVLQMPAAVYFFFKIWTSDTFFTYKTPTWYNVWDSITDMFFGITLILLFAQFLVYLFS